MISTISISSRTRLEVDPAECIPEDPGAGTPCMVHTEDEDGREYSATFGCALDTGEVEHIQLSPTELDRMNRSIPLVNKILGREWFL